MRRAFAAYVAAVFCHAVTHDGALSLLVFVGVVAAIGSARKSDT